MSDVPQESGWWQASDDKWYPPPDPGEESEVGAVPVSGFAPPAVPSPYGDVPAAPPRPGNRTPLFVALGVVAAAVVGIVIVLTGGDDGDAETSPTTTEQPTSTDDPDGTTGTDTTGEGGGSSSAVEGIEVVETGFSSVRDHSNDLRGSYGFVLENTGDGAQTDLQLSVAFYDANDTVVGSSTQAVAVLRAGETIGIGDTPTATLSAEVARIEVEVGQSSVGGSPVPEGAFTVEGVSVTSDEYATQATFTVQSSYGEQVDSPYSYAVFRDASGAIVGGASSFLEFVPANGRVAGTVLSSTPIPEATDADVFVDQGSL